MRSRGFLGDWGRRGSLLLAGVLASLLVGELAIRLLAPHAEALLSAGSMSVW